MSFNIRAHPCRSVANNPSYSVTSVPPWWIQSSFRPEEAVARVADALEDVGVPVEPLVHGGGEDADLRVAPLHLPHTIGGRQQGDRPDVGSPAFFEDGDARDKRPPRGEHRVEDDSDAAGE